MKRLPILFLVATALLGCGTTRPAINAENKKVVYIYHIDITYPQKKPDMTAKVINTVSLLKLGLPQVVPTERSEYKPNNITVYWEGNNNRFNLNAKNYVHVPHTPYLEEVLREGVWVYYNANASDPGKIFTPCPTYCGPAGKPSLSELKHQAKYLTTRENEQDHRTYIERRTALFKSRAPLSEQLQEGTDFRARKAARAEKLKKELERIEADYKRANK